MELFEPDTKPAVVRDAMVEALLQQGESIETEHGTLRWHEVSVRRARALRRLGVLCLFSHYTAKGKARFVYCSLSETKAQ